jgi:hypothetical protein
MPKHPRHDTPQAIVFLLEMDNTRLPVWLPISALNASGALFASRET